jgi:hypothetical protein
MDDLATMEGVMKAIMRWGSGLVALLLFTSVSFSWEWQSPVFRTPFPQNPDACGPGWYNMGHCGMVYGPNYYVVPPWLPFNGMLPGKQGDNLMCAKQGIPPWHVAQARAAGMIPGTPAPPQNFPRAPGTPFTPPTPPHPDQPLGPGIYPSHPYVRSPRDFFMFSEVLEDARGQAPRPLIVR